jgi:transposase-like protein
LREVAELGYRVVGQRYGVSDNAVRKWVRLYEREIGNQPVEAAPGGITPA